MNLSGDMCLNICFVLNLLNKTKFCGKSVSGKILFISPFVSSDDDIIFEDFARQRLIGAKDDKEEEEEGTDSPKLNDR